MEIYNLPFGECLNIGNRMGPTDYLDFIRLDEVKYPFMKGIDKYGRYFFVLKLKINNDIIMETYFQRYSYGMNWQACGKYSYRFLYTCGGGLNKDQKDLLINLIKGEKIKIQEKHITSGTLIGNMVMLYDEKKEKAASIIQKQWRTCRYNPKFIMCEKVLMRGLHEIEKQYN